MARKIIDYKTEDEWHGLRAKVITSTDVSALFGLSPYLSEFELWHLKKNGATAEFTANDRTRWGTRLERSIAEGVAEDNGWSVQPKKHFIMDDELLMGSSFDYEITKPMSALLEIKNVDALQFREKWDVDGDNIEAPMHIEMQAMYQMLVAGVAEAYIGALIGGNQVKLIKREIDNDIAKSIQEKVFEFWESIRKGIPPAPDFTRDAAFIGKLYRSVEAGSLIESTSGDAIAVLAERYHAAGAAEKAAVEAKQAAKAELLTLIGEAEKVKGENFSISASMTAPTRVEAYDRAGFRNFRVTFKKAKGD